MREVQVRIWCDPCIRDDPDARVEAVAEHTQSIDGGKPKRLGYCELHDKTLVVPNVELLAEFGADPDDMPSKAPKRGPGRPYPPIESAEGRVQCTRCPKHLSDRTHMLGHMTKDHGLTLAEASREVPPRGPTEMCPVLVDGVECGYLGGAGTGMGAHIKQRHTEADLVEWRTARGIS